MSSLTNTFYITTISILSIAIIAPNSPITFIASGIYIIACYGERCGFFKQNGIQLFVK